MVHQFSGNWAKVWMPQVLDKRNHQTTFKKRVEANGKSGFLRDPEK